MSEKDKKDPNRRDFIITATATVGAVGAGAVVVSIPVTILFISLSRFLVSGLTVGSVKG